MKSTDIVIIGGGIIGLTLAALLENAPCRISVVEPQSPIGETSRQAHRVIAINHTSQQIFQQLGIWQCLSETERAAYDKMFVWEKDSFAQIQFDNHDQAIKSLGLEQLGFIIANHQIHTVLWEKLKKQDNVEIIASGAKSIGFSENGAFLTLENGEMISSKLVIGADGANSWLRKQANIPLVSRDYQHTALVCTVKTAESHEKTAWQIFAPDSILAFLPLYHENFCSIVWSLPPEKAEALAVCDEGEFNQALNIAFDNRLGLVELQNSREIYPLVARYARDFAAPRLALIGDAAHTIHPLAGLGANLGIADAKCLAEQIQRNLALGHDIGEYRHLRHFERVRKVEAVKLLAAMEGIKQLFEGNNPLKKLVRGVGLSVTNQNSFIKKLLIEQAIGV